jgi:hypothetical protein
MHDFTKRILISKGFTAEFLFNHIFTFNGVRYYVSVTDGKGQTLGFNMEKKYGRWKIIDAPKVPGWIMNIEEQLEDAISENIS